jgi:hypothetical protein
VEDRDLQGTLMLENTKPPHLTSAGLCGIRDKKGVENGIELEMKDVVQLVASNSMPGWASIDSTLEEVAEPELEPSPSKILDFLEKSTSNHAKFAVDFLDSKKNLLLVHSSEPLTKASNIGAAETFCPAPGQEEVSVADLGPLS